MSTTILLTGASGLLGRAIKTEFQSDSNIRTIGLAYSRLSEKLRKVDLTIEKEVEAIILETRPDIIIHSAAERRPDVVDKKEDATFNLNVSATKSICKFAAQIETPVLFISTDYVFDGKSPPYKEHDATNPLNKYGLSKREGEQVVLEFSKGNLVLRVPILYGQVECLEESAVTTLFSKVKDSKSPCVMSHYERRFPTHTRDVASVLAQLVQKRLTDPSLNGIFHWSGSENMTKYDMAMSMGSVFGLPVNHIQPDDKPSLGAPRPFNTNLATGRLNDLGIGAGTLFKDGIKESLKEFM